MGRMHHDKWFISGYGYNGGYSDFLNDVIEDF